MGALLEKCGWSSATGVVDRRQCATHVRNAQRMSDTLLQLVVDGPYIQRGKNWSEDFADFGS